MKQNFQKSAKLLAGQFKRKNQQLVGCNLQLALIAFMMSLNLIWMRYTTPKIVLEISLIYISDNCLRANQFAFEFNDKKTILKLQPWLKICADIPTECF